MPLDGRCEAPLIVALRAEQARIEEVHNRPQLGEVVLNGRTGQRHAGRSRCYGPLVSGERSGS